MTSINFNKLVRPNFRPWPISKTTTKIVNHCIDTLYKESKKHFQKDLVPMQLAEERMENKAPIRTLKAQERLRQPVNILPRNKNCLATLGNGDLLLNAVMLASKKSKTLSTVSTKSAGRKSPNYQIYSNRRMGSSASSSNASIFRRYDDRIRSQGMASGPPIATSQKSAIMGAALRSFATQHRGTSYCVDPTASKYMMPLRNQQIESTFGSMPNAKEVSMTIQRDLMLVDPTVKKRISVGKQRLEKIVQEQQHPKSDPMGGWHHPRSSSLFADFNSERNKERMIAHAELQAQYVRLKTASRDRQFENLRLLEKRAAQLGIIKSPPQTHISEASYAAPALPPVRSARSGRSTFSTSFVQGREPLERVEHRAQAERSTTRRAPIKMVALEAKRAKSDVRSGASLAPTAPIQSIHRGHKEFQMYADSKEHRGHKDSKELKEHKDHKGHKEYKTYADSKEHRGHKDSKELKDHKGQKEYKMYADSKEYKMYPDSKEYKMYPDSKEHKMYADSKEHKKYADSKEHKMYADSKEHKKYADSKEHKMYADSKEHKKYADSKEHKMYADSKEHKMYADSKEHKMYADSKEHRGYKESKELKDYKDHKGHREYKMYGDSKEQKSYNEYKAYMESKEHRGPKELKESKELKDRRDHRDHRDHKDLKGQKEYKMYADSKEHRGYKESKELKDHRDHRDQRDHRDHRDHRDQRDQRDQRDHRDHNEHYYHKDHKDPKDNKGHKEYKMYGDSKDQKSYKEYKGYMEYRGHKGPKVPPAHSAPLSTASKLPVQHPVSRSSKTPGPTATSLVAAQTVHPVLSGNQTSRFNRSTYIATSKKY